MKTRTSFEVIADHLPARLRTALYSLSAAERQGISEVRLNSGRALAVIYPKNVMYMTGHGLTASPKNTAVLTVSPVDIADTVEQLSRYSIHSCTRELREGFFVLGGGVRAGLSGAYSSDGMIHDITGLNFRISRNIKDCAVEIFRIIERENCGILICGGVNSGKTTLLRDLCRLIGDRRKVTLVDERNEIAYTRGGMVENDVGTLTNVLTGCTRGKGIVAAVRTLSPDYIFCDELAAAEDVRAMTESIGCGVRFCATIHGESFDELMKRKVAAELIDSGIFGYAAMLRGAQFPGEIAEIRRLT